MFLNPHPLHAVQRAVIAGLLAGSAVQAAAQTAPVRSPRATAPALATPAPAPVATPPAASPRPAAPALVCTQVEEAVLPLSSGLTTRYTPSSPVLRLVLDEQAPQSGVAGAAALDAPAAPAPGGMALVTREPVNAQAVAPRPGVGEIAVRLLGPNDIYFTGKRIGSTNVVLVHANGQCTMLSLVVGMDPLALQRAIDSLLPEEAAIVAAADRVKVSSAFDSLVLRGTVSDTEALQRVTDLANAYLRGSGTAGNAGATAGNPRLVNMLSVAAPQQVMLEVKVAEVSKNLLDQFGIDFSRAYVPGDGSMVRFLAGIFGGGVGLLGQISRTGPNNVPYSSVDAVVGGTVPVPGAVGGNVVLTPQGYVTQYGNVPGRGVTNGVLNMQKNDGLVKVLAEPSVMAISGQTGSFLAGGKIFIPVASTTTAGVREVTLEEKEFGVSVRFTPTVLGGGRINLKVRPEVSELAQGGVTIAGVGGTAILPAFTSRKAETTVQLMDGQSFVIGGLIKNNTTTNVKAFPFLGELPIIGALFRSTEFQTDRTELVFVITPRLVKPLPADYRLPTDGYVPPTRKELILEGRLEGRAAAAPADAAGSMPAAPAAAATPQKPLPAAPPGGGFDNNTKPRE